MEISDWIDLAAVVVNALLAYWIVSSMQNKLTNKRILKDYFIQELKEIRNEYRSCLNNLYANQTLAIKVIPWFKLMNIKVDDLMTLINTKYAIDKKLLDPYQNKLRELITENQDFINQFKSTKPVEFSAESKNKIIIFQQEYNHLFNDLIIGINDHG